MKFKRIFLVVLDSVGVGEAHDALLFDDVGANTFGNIVKKTNVSLPNLRKLGYHNLALDDNANTIDYYMKGIEVSNGKDTLTGHLEMMGVITKEPFKTFTETGFPQDLINELENRTGRKVIGNCNASGTEIIERLGEEHMKTRAIIVYTSADSVLQIAAHEDIVPLDELYKICEIARELTLKEEWKVGRIIARPFIGEPGQFIRTSNRHDYALDPAHKTCLDYLKENNLSIISIGKISDIFNGCGITEAIRTKDNADGILKIKEVINRNFNGLCFANLNDFDSKYGHRRDVEGYANALKYLDSKIDEIIVNLTNDDLLMIVADHGNDPTYKGTDHTREYIPVLVYSKAFKETGRLEDLKVFADIGKTILDNFDIENNEVGESFLEKLK